jgi:hypothetical protein
VELGDGAVGGEEARREVLVRAAHDGHLGTDVQLAHVAGAVGLAEHTVDVSGEVVEPEGEVEVHEAVLAGPAVRVPARGIRRAPPRSMSRAQGGREPLDHTRAAKIGHER